MFICCLLTLIFALFVPTASQNWTFKRPLPGQDWTIPYQCDFDNDFCDCKQDSSEDDFDWNRASGRLPHSDTGPQFGDHTSGFGFYAFINSSAPRKEGDLARIITPTLRYNSPCATITFWFYALGLNLGSFTLRSGVPDGVTPYSNWSIVFRISGPDRTRAWRRVQTTIFTDAVFRLTFEARVGNGYQGAYAIDDIEVASIDCPKTLKLEKPPPPGWAVSFNTSIDDGGNTPRPNGWGRPQSTVPPGDRVATTRPAKPDDFPTWAIAILVIACIFVAGVVLFLVVRHIRKQRKHGSSGSGSKYATRNVASNLDPTTPSTSAGTSIEDGRDPSSHFTRNRHGISYDSDASSFEMPTKQMTINVPVEGSAIRRDLGNKSVRFQTDYDTEYGFGLRLNAPIGSSVPSALTPVPQELMKEAEKLEKKSSKRKRQRSKLTVRQRRRLRIQAKMAAKMKAEQEADPNNLKPATFSLLEPKDADKYGLGPGRKKPIPLPPPHVLDMMMKMRSASNPLNRVRSDGNIEQMDAAGGSNSVVAVIEPAQMLPRRLSHHKNDLDVADIEDDDDFDDDEEDDGDDDMEAEDGSDVTDDISSVDSRTMERWEPSQLGSSSNSRSGAGMVAAQSGQRNQVTVINHSQPHQTPNQPIRPAAVQQQSTTSAQVHHQPAPAQSTPGLYDGLDDDDDN